MGHEEFRSSYNQPPFERGHRHGPEGEPMHRWGDHPHHGEFESRHWGRQRPPFMHGPHRFGPPWRHGEWHRDPERERAHEALRGLRPTVISLIALVRAAEPHQVEAVQGVLSEARKRIAAILAEQQPAKTGGPAPDTDHTML